MEYILNVQIWSMKLTIHLTPVKHYSQVAWEQSIHTDNEIIPVSLLSPIPQAKKKKKRRNEGITTGTYFLTFFSLAFTSFKNEYALSNISWLNVPDSSSNLGSLLIYKLQYWNTGIKLILDVLFLSSTWVTMLSFWLKKVDVTIL